jgi:hypothetical protein
MPKIVDEIKSQNAMESLSRSHSRNLRAEESEMDNSKVSKKDSRHSFNDPQSQRGQPRREKDEDQKSNYSRKSSKKGLKAAKK